MPGKLGHPYTLEASTDIGGILPWMFNHIWYPYLQDLDGVEVIAWKGTTPLFLRSPSILPVTRLHGQIGGGGVDKYDETKVMWYDRTLVSDQELLRLATTHQIDVLIHTPHAANGFFANYTRFNTHSLQPVSLKKGDSIGQILIWIENHVGGESGVIEQKNIAAHYQSQQIPVNLMFDLAHYIQPRYQENFQMKWQHMIQQLAHLTTLHQVGVHFPIGDLDYDSIPVLNYDLITDTMLQDLKKTLQHVQTIVFEYQSPLNNYLLPFRYYRVQQRLAKVWTRLKKIGII